MQIVVGFENPRSAKNQLLVKKSPKTQELSEMNKPPISKLFAEIYLL